MPPWSVVVKRRYDRLAPYHHDDRVRHHRTRPHTTAPLPSSPPGTIAVCAAVVALPPATMTDLRDVTVRDDAAPVARQDAEQPARPESALSSATTTAALCPPDPCSRSSRGNDVPFGAALTGLSDSLCNWA
jgi:hypothetical protein